MDKAKITRIIKYVLGMGVLEYVLSFPFRFVENWAMGYLSDKLSEYWRSMLSFAIVWILPFGLLCIAILIAYRIGKRGSSEAKAPIKPPNNISELVLVTKQNIELNINNTSGGWIKFLLDMANCSNFALKIAYIDGRIDHNSEVFHYKPEIKSQSMMQGQKATLIIQQQLLPDEAQRISKWASTNNGLTLRFELGRLDIEVQKGKNNLGKLNLESRMKYLINQDAQGFYSWKEIINA